MHSGSLVPKSMLHQPATTLVAKGIFSSPTNSVYVKRDSTRCMRLDPTAQRKAGGTVSEANIWNSSL